MNSNALGGKYNKKGNIVLLIIGAVMAALGLLVLLAGMSAMTIIFFLIWEGLSCFVMGAAIFYLIKIAKRNNRKDRHKGEYQASDWEE